MHRAERLISTEVKVTNLYFRRSLKATTGYWLRRVSHCVLLLCMGQHDGYFFVKFGIRHFY